MMYNLKSEHWGRFTEDFCPGYGTEVTDDTEVAI